MGLEALINQPENELQLLRKVAEVVQSEFGNHPLPFHYIKLKRNSDQTSEIAWIKSFDNREAYVQQIFSSKFRQAKIVVYLHGDHFRITLGGFDFVTFAQIFSNRIEYFRTVWPSGSNIESTVAPPRELVDAAFGDLKHQVRVSTKKRRRA